MGLSRGNGTYYHHSTYAITRADSCSYTTNILEETGEPIPTQCAVQTIPVTFGAREYFVLLVGLVLHDCDQ